MTTRSQIIKLYKIKMWKRKYSYDQIAKKVGVSKAWVFQVIKDYLAEKDEND